MSKAWFAPKQYGYGSSLPISWEGWAVLFGYLVGTVTPSVLIHLFIQPPLSWLLWAAVMVVMTTAFVLIARAKTEGGWKWRNGGA